MKTLTIERMKGQRRELQSIGWKRPKEGDCRRQFFAQNAKGKPVLLKPVPAAPDFYRSGYPAVFNGEPFPEAVCVELVPCRLLPPPCYESCEDFTAQRRCQVVFDPWRATSLRTHNQALYLKPAADTHLQERLDKFLMAMRAACDKEKTDWQAKIDRLTSTPLQNLQIASEEERQVRIAEARQQLAYVASETQPIRSDGRPDNSAGWLKLTLDDIKRGVLGIRDSYLHEQWAKDNGEDLEAMAQERLLFRQWLETHTGTPANIIDLDAKEKRKGVSPPRLGERFENNPQFLEACAKVKYRARFADNAGTVVYLSDFEEREELDAAELEEVGRLRQDASPPAGVPVQVEGSRNYSIRDMGSHFEIVWAGNTLTAKRSDGIKYLAKFLLEPARQWKAVQLYMEVAATVIPDELKGEQDGDGEEDPKITSSDKAEARRNLARLRERKCQVERTVTELAAKRKQKVLLEEEKVELAEAVTEAEQIQKEIERETQIANGTKLRNKDDEAIKKDTIKRRINGSLKEMCDRYTGTLDAQACQAFYGHVRRFLMADFLTAFRYEPDPALGITWD